MDIGSHEIPLIVCTMNRTSITRASMIRTSITRTSITSVIWASVIWAYVSCSSSAFLLLWACSICWSNQFYSQQKQCQLSIRECSYLYNNYLFFLFISECNTPAGIEDGTLPDQSLVATSNYSTFVSQNARLNGNSGWCTNITDGTQSITVSLSLVD